jgi:hypothetical protein
MATLFVPLDVNYSEDEKIIDVGPMAELLYIRGLVFVKRARSDGMIRSNQLRVVAARIPNARRLAERLVHAGLWKPDGEGWYIVAWLKRNPLADDQTDAGIAGAHKRWHLKRKQPNPDCELCVAEGLVKP